jgi:hypothetical protein
MELFELAKERDSASLLPLTNKQQCNAEQQGESDSTQEAAHSQAPRPVSANPGAALVQPSANGACPL